MLNLYEQDAVGYLTRLQETLKRSFEHHQVRLGQEPTALYTMASIQLAYTKRLLAQGEKKLPLTIDATGFPELPSWFAYLKKANEERIRINNDRMRGFRPVLQKFSDLNFAEIDTQTKNFKTIYSDDEDYMQVFQSVDEEVFDLANKFPNVPKKQFFITSDTLLGELTTHNYGRSQFGFKYIDYVISNSKEQNNRSILVISRLRQQQLLPSPTWPRLDSLPEQEEEARRTIERQIEVLSGEFSKTFLSLDLTTSTQTELANIIASLASANRATDTLRSVMLHSANGIYPAAQLDVDLDDARDNLKQSAEMMPDGFFREKLQLAIRATLDPLAAEPHPQRSWFPWIVKR